MTSAANGIRSYDKAVTSDRDGHLIGPSLDQEFVDRPAGTLALIADDLAGGGRVEHELADLVPGNTPSHLAIRAAQEAQSVATCSTTNGVARPNDTIRRLDLEPTLTHRRTGPVSGS